jgi:hypothetical protein
MGEHYAGGSGGVVPPGERRFVQIFESELDVVRDEAVARLETETGGNLYGLFGHDGDPVIFFATRPAGRPLRSRGSLAQDPRIDAMLEEMFRRDFGLQFLGTWHAHHWIGLTKPSRRDLRRIRAHAITTGRPAYTEILANFARGDAAAGPLRAAARPVPADTSRVRLTPFLYRDARVLALSGASLRALRGSSPVRAAIEASGLSGEVTAALRPARPAPAPGTAPRAEGPEPRPLAVAPGTGHGNARAVPAISGHPAGRLTGRPGPEVIAMAWPAKGGGRTRRPPLPGPRPG